MASPVLIRPFGKLEATMQKLLLIDDDPLVIQDMLTLMGYEVVVATDGYAGFQTFCDMKDSINMIILDIQMPGMDGWNVLNLIRNGDVRPNVPIIMLTSSNDEKSLISGLRRGADAYLTKPITPTKLIAHLEAISRRIQWESQTGESVSSADLGNIGILTHRERELLKFIVKGFSNQQIANELNISETTVKNHLTNIFKKLNVTNRTQAAYIAQKLHFK